MAQPSILAAVTIGLFGSSLAVSVGAIVASVWPARTKVVAALRGGWR